MKVATDQGDIEVLEPGTEISTPEVGTSLMQVTKGEVDMQIATAKQYPRSITEFKRRAASLVTMDVETAESCNYSVPRAGKTITGPSARFFEIIGYEWSNLRQQAMPVGEDDRFVTVRGMCWDIEKNVAKAIDVKRRITDKNGKKFNEDMIGVTTAAATAIALRNATQQTIPKAYWLPIYNLALQTIKGDVKTLNEKRDRYMAFFATHKVPEAMVFAALGVKGKDDITLEHVPQLAGFVTQIKDGSLSIEQIFTPDETGASGEQARDPLSDYLSSVDDELGNQIRQAFGTLKLNRGQVAAILKQHDDSPKNLLAELQGRLAAAAKPVGQASTSKPAEKTQTQEKAAETKPAQTAKQPPLTEEF